MQDVVKAVQHLKLGQSGREEELYSEHLINAPHRLLVILCHIFNAMIIHGICPNSMPIVTKYADDSTLAAAGGTLDVIEQKLKPDICKIVN